METSLHVWKWKAASVGSVLLLAVLACVQARGQSISGLSTGVSAGLNAGQGFDLAANAYAGSVTTAHATTEAIPLSLDDAVRRGLAHNLAVVLAEQNERIASGQRLQQLNNLLPNISAVVVRRRNQINLAALGFRPGLLAQFPPGIFPAGVTFGPIVTVNVVAAQANLQQPLFNLSAIEEFRAAKGNRVAAYYSTQSARGQVIQNVATTYLQVLDDMANLDNARALLATDDLLQRQAGDAVQAGTATHLDFLRAQVQMQQQEQAEIAAENALAKAKIALNRQIGLAAEQPIQLTDVTPYADLDTMTLAQARQMAYANRQDYQGAQAQARAANFQRKAARFERVPTLSFGGNYGVTGTVGGIYHGTFIASGELSVPIFREASLRGDHDVAEAERSRALAQLADLRVHIDAQLRDSLLDVAAAKQLVEVAHSNVDLARQSLSDATDRFTNGVEDNLAVVQAQAVLAAAQAQWVNSLYQFNQSKLGLARNLGILQQQYRAYLGK